MTRIWHYFHQHFFLWKYSLMRLQVDVDFFNGTNCNRCPRTTHQMRLCGVQFPDSLGGQVYLFFKTLRKNRCLACNSFPHHWNKAEYSGDAPDDDDLDYNQHFIVIHSQPIIILIGVHWFIKFRTQSTLNLVVREILVSSPAPTDEKQGASKSWIWVERR